MPTNICERTLFVNKIIRRYEDDVPAVKQRLREGEDRLLLDEISSLRAEVSRLSAELEGARKETIEAEQRERMAEILREQAERPIGIKPGRRNPLANGRAE